MDPRSPQEQNQKLVEILIDLKDSNSIDNEIICKQLLDDTSKNKFTSCLYTVQSLITKELEYLKIKELPSFFELFIVDITKYGPWFLLQPSSPGLDKVRDTLIGSLIEKLLKATSTSFALKISSTLEIFFNYHISVKYQNFMYKNPVEGNMLKALQERLLTKIQDFPYFKKFSQLQAQFLFEKFERLLVEVQNSSQEKNTQIMTKGFEKWVEDLDNSLYKAFDPHFSDFNEGTIPPNQILTRELGKNYQRQMSAPINSKTLVDVSINEVPESLARICSSKETSNTKLFQNNEPSVQPEKPKKNDTVVKPQKNMMPLRSNTNSFNKFRLDPDLKKMEFYIQYSDIDEVESVTLPQRLYYLNQKTIV